MTECYECSRLAELVAENSALRAANDMKATESDVRTLGVDANDASVDTREKLEADVRQILHSAYMFAWMHGNENRRGGSFKNLHREFYNLLDRQEEITEREREQHWLEIVGASANANVELKRQIDERQARVDELTEQLESAHAKNRSLKAHIAKMQDGRHGWHVKYSELEKKNAELEAKVDELTAELVRDTLSACNTCAIRIDMQEKLEKIREIAS